jgi:hypothetical protein
MIDTLRLLCTARPTEEQLSNRWVGHSKEQFGKSVPVKYTCNPDPASGFRFRLTYRRTSYIYPNLLSIEFSLPKLILGNNWEMLWDIPGAITLVDDILARYPALPELPSIAHMPNSRLDVCYNHHLGNDLPAYLEALSRMDYPRRDIHRINAETVAFHAKSVGSKFYDKHAETDGEAPYGMLRHEITFNRGAPVKRAFNRNRPVTLLDCGLPSLCAILQHDLDVLGASQRCFVNPDHAYELLVDKYGNNRGPRLFGIWTKYQHLDRDALARLTKVKRNAITRDLADIKKAGVALGAVENSLPLPPLTMSIPEPVPPVVLKTCTQTPGITPGSLGNGDGPEDADDEAEGGDEDEA